MRPEILAKIYDYLQAPAGELEFLIKLDDREGETLARRLSQTLLHCRPETYADTHWEDD